MTFDSDETRLPTSLWIDAHLRILSGQGIGYYIVNKGAFASGTLLLKISLLNGHAKLLMQVRDMDGKLGWMSAFKTELVIEQDADSYIHRAIDRDPDLWVVEIEDKQGINPFEEKNIV
ncbi:MAG: DUF1491 family protein [Alphaproteobacteria bacterium]|jgi:hypothetical protein|nr:DUF1491 family protein [Alphaproteobacteria bacterium]MCB1551257.1 DUF1491 family protein [Alphaproteobacteria bacterium]MCB9984526.1 DUF1491 family protein [Micavibrio sp.]HRK97709.1 DUF1491 family protein [Alphaproteobacteria bacterium]